MTKNSQNSNSHRESNHSHASTKNGPTAEILKAQVDVIVPVYRDFKATLRCLQSLLAHPQKTPFEIVVINDASPDGEIVKLLEKLKSENKITQIDNPVNIGFVDSANLGMMLHLDRDVVILNSDTEVSGDWLDRLRRAALSTTKVGTVTPFSNNATLASYPRYMSNNQLPEGWTLPALDAIFKKINKGQLVQVPTAVGFCTYITRRCLNAVGYFDSLHFGHGYGEENDFCMRAAAAGFKHLLCGNVFVYHQGGASFGNASDARSNEAQKTLAKLHPSYWPQVVEHCGRDPERPLRRRIDTARLAYSPRPKVLFITHRLGGGTEKHIQELVHLIKQDVDVLILRPLDSEKVMLEWAPPEEEFSACFSLSSEYQQLVDFLKDLGISRIHFHHTVELHRQALSLPVDLEVPYDFTIHDYYTICPFTNLVTSKGEYCGEPPLDDCMTCFNSREAPGELDPATRREFYAHLLADADRVIAPSKDTLERTAKYFPGVNLVLMPHPEPAPPAKAPAKPAPPSSPGKTIKVLVLGELSLAKGLGLLEACATDAAQRQLPLYFRVLGRPLSRVRREPEIPLSFSGPYNDADLSSLIKHEDADVIFFPARWPETYSYTLTTALSSGLPIAAPKLGAFPERLKDASRAWLFKWDSPPAVWNDFFVSLKKEWPLQEQ